LTLYRVRCAADVIGQQNAESVRASKQVLDRGIALADTLADLYMLVVDTSASISVATGDIIETVTSEFDIVSIEAVVNELAETAEYDDRHSTAARDVSELVEDKGRRCLR
jgi:hypothetical protein